MTSATARDAKLTEILVDAGPLIAGFDDTDVWHVECSRRQETLSGPLIVLATIVAEVCYICNFVTRGDIRGRHQ